MVLRNVSPDAMAGPWQTTPERQDKAMTEEQAKTKWCPMVRGGLNVHTTWGSPREPGAEQRNPAAARCIGSDCMMWRWNEKYKANGTPDPDPVQGEHGYCGLAGKPFPAMVNP